MKLSEANERSGPLGRALWTGLALLGLGAPMAAQNFNQLDAPGSRGVPTLGGEGLDALMMRASTGGGDPFEDYTTELAKLYPPGWQRVDPNLSVFQGFPSLTPTGFGAYPGGSFPVPFQTDIELTPGPAYRVKRPPNTWPSWFPEGGEEPGGFRADVGILAQATDYVWIKDPNRRAFVPLAYWDRFRVFSAGTAIEVRGAGQFVMVFHEGGRLRISGSSRMVIRDLMPEVIDLGFDRVTMLYGVVNDRPMRIQMGFAGTLEALNTTVRIEPERGFSRVENQGPGTLKLETAEREVEIPKGFMVRLMLAGQTEREYDSELALRGGLETSRDGRVLKIDGSQDGGTVKWSGAVFRVRAGAVLKLDPLAGEKFPENKVGVTPR